MERQVVQQRRIHQSVNRCVRSDSQRQREHRDCGESWIFSNQAESESCVLVQILQPAPAPRIPRHFSHQANVSEFPPRSSLRVARRRSPLHALRFRHTQMMLNFFFQLRVSLAPIPPQFHDAPSFFAGFNTSATPASCRYLSTSLLFSIAYSLTRISAPPSDRRASLAAPERNMPA